MLLWKGLLQPSEVVRHKSGCSSLSNKRSEFQLQEGVPLGGDESVEGPGGYTGVCDDSEALSVIERQGQRSYLSSLENVFNSFP